MNKKKGFTLIETMAAVCILSILFLGVYAYVMTANKVQSETFVKIKAGTTIQGIESFLYAERNNMKEDYFKENLLNKDIVIQGSNLLSIIETLNSNMNGKENFYNNTNGKIEEIVEIKAKEESKGLYNLNISLYTLNKNKEYKERKVNPIEYGKENGSLDNINLLIRAITLQGGN